MNLESKTIKMRLVQPDDAKFIHSLRTNEKYNSHLSKITGDVNQQRKWIEKYKVLEKESKEFYFIIEKLDGMPCGTVRVYDLTDNSFCWGSWILNENKTKYSAIESALLVYKFGFDILDYSESHFDVRKANEKVLAFHKKMGAVEYKEDSDNYYFRVSKFSIDKVRKKFSKLL
ncbi:GNAT family N-acetyltransferase [Photobacterium indicum]|uniref:N-acetyltransferase n=1 Tax=Photobacterium indicum TaxID=81447 RepID=A0A2T3L7X7_9GAMM|nr:GNAT family N-acetyltransferase [Photobacterium indicum]PSV46789.1 N-acetyltransferase [Photobacterium indicum]